MGGSLEAFSIDTTLLDANVVSASGTVAATSSDSGSLRSSGGLGVAGRAYFGGVLVVESEVDATSSASGAMVVHGGLGVTGGAISSPLLKSESVTLTRSGMPNDDRSLPSSGGSTGTVVQGSHQSTISKSV